MKKIYLLFLPIFFILISACSKDAFKSYDKRIVGGTWELYDVNTFGFGSRYNPAFVNGYFTFMESGRLQYQTPQGEVYQGSWDIRSDRRSGDDTEVHSLFVTVVNFQTQDVLSEYFDEMWFTGTDRLKTQVSNSGSRTYIFKFKR
jgi:hypothetical protein